MSAPLRTPAWRLPLLLAALLAAALLYRWNEGRRARPLTYRIGAVDERFGVSREAFAAAVARAASLWGQAVHRELFREAPDGALEIRLVYDYRQEAADRLKSLDLKIGDAQGSYEQLKAHFETLRGEADQRGAALAQDFAAYEARVAAFNTQSEAARRAPVSEGAFRRMEADRSELAEAKAALLRRREELRELGQTLAGLALAINDLAARHNLDLVDHRRTGGRLGPEFAGGDYVQEGRRRAISIYHLPSADGLVRLLAHELGHARGLPHLDNPRAVMHRLQRTDSPELTPEDIAAMKAAAEGW